MFQCYVTYKPIMMDNKASVVGKQDLYSYNVPIQIQNSEFCRAF